MLSLGYVQVRLGDIITVNRPYAWEDTRPRSDEAPREWPRAEHRKGNKGKTRSKGVPKGQHGESTNKDIVASL